MSAAVCTVCPHACKLESGEFGICAARQGMDGEVVPVNYGRCTAIALDPIEKKPLGRYHQGSKILSYGSFGCNLSCSFCQNWEIAQVGEGTQDAEERISFARHVLPDELIKMALELKSKGNIGIALTYNEPLICPEYILDVSELAHKKDLKLALVTNGYATPETAKRVFAVTDATNIDLKAFNQDFYTQVGAPAGFATVKKTIEIAMEAGCHVEITTLVIPGLNDSPEDIEKEAAWIASLDPEIPLHLSRYHPAYKMTDREATPRETIYDLARIAHRHLTFVYTGNMHTDDK